MFITGVLAAKMNGNGLGSSNSSSSENNTTVTMGTLQNVAYGSGYGYSAGRFGGTLGRTGGSNPSPSTLDIGGETFNHLYVGEWSQYGNRSMNIEIPFVSNASNHPTSNWLTSLEISDGQGNSVELDMSNFTRYNHTGSPYYSRGATYRRSGYSSNFVDATNNNKTLTWDFV